ncbi:MAG TPA: DUF2764 family protein, partial [Prolixibacteraceae bacterium]|nr:DUF2764 family protein [Prolixibacteraceae bacterium]
MGKYYYLISGLPELQLDDQKLKLSLSEFKSELDEHLSASDRKVIAYFFMQFDNENLLKFLSNKEAGLNPLGNLNSTQFDEMLMRFKETDNPNESFIHGYFKEFIPAYLSETPVYPQMSWDDQLTSLYYDFASKSKNEFVAQWFQFNLNINNVFAALNCMRYGYNREASVIGSSEIADAIRTSNSKDFGIAPLFPEVEELIRLADEADILERERKIDLLRWNWLEEKGFFHYFDVEHIFVYLVRL